MQDWVYRSKMWGGSGTGYRSDVWCRIGYTGARCDAGLGTGYRSDVWCRIECTGARCEAVVVLDTGVMCDAGLDVQERDVMQLWYWIQEWRVMQDWMYRSKMWCSSSVYRSDVWCRTGCTGARCGAVVLDTGVMCDAGLGVQEQDVMQ